LNYLKKALGKNEQSDSNSTFSWLKNTVLSKEEQDQKSQEFMKLISHSMPKESYSRVIRLIEEYCEELN
jgi:tetrahydrodipicolinate N-succinyltransferase